MKTTEVEHPWEQQEDDDVEEGLIARRKNLNQAPVSATINADFSNNNGASAGVTNGEDQEEEEVKDLSQQNGIKVVEDNHEKEKQQTSEGDFSSNNVGVTNGEDGELDVEELQVQDLSQQNGIEVVEDDKEKEKQQTSEYLVYYDADKGIWKCRICSWNNLGKTCLTPHNQRLCFFETKGTGLHLESSKVEVNGVDLTFHGKIPMKDIIDITKLSQENRNGNGTHYINIQNGEHEKQNNLPETSLQPSEVSFEEVDKTEISEIEVIKDVENEFDVETVIKKQETHDLFCPNCNSCITKRVILRKRKRKIPVPGDLPKRNKPETSNPSEGNLVSDDVQPLISDEYDNERDTDVFRCLSCFSIFMPTGNGFKLFRMFGNKSNVENNQSSRKEVGVKPNWFKRIFASDKVEQLNNQGSWNPEGNSHTTNVNMNLENDQLQSATPSANQQQNSNTKGYGVNGRSDVVSLTPGVNGDKNASYSAQASNTMKQPTAQESDNAARESKGTWRPKANSLHTTNGNRDLEKDQVQSTTPGDNGNEDALGSNTVKQPIADELDSAVKEGTDSQSGDSPDHLLTSYHTEFNTQTDYPGMFVVKPPLNNIEPQQDLISPNYHDGLTLHVPPNVGSLIIDNSQMNQLLDVTIQNNPDLEIGSRAVEQGGGVAATGGRGLDIVKSIVYGGLLEIIASLSVVASAVGADAATLNVLALGLANIFGGLLVISHDLWDLKNEARGSSDEDRYQQLLGRRADFPLHVLVSLLSYLVCGFLPPVVYGFSFRESNDRDSKLLMVAAASIVCITILAAGKAYVQSPRKSYIKTISYYVVFGFVVSGVSYLFGEMIMKLLEKIGIFPSDQVVNLSVLGVSTNPALTAAF